MASYAVKKRTDGKKKHYYWNDYRFEGGKIVKYRRIPETVCSQSFNSNSLFFTYVKI